MAGRRTLLLATNDLHQPHIQMHFTKIRPQRWNHSASRHFSSSCTLSRHQNPLSHLPGKASHQQPSSRCPTIRSLHTSPPTHATALNSSISSTVTPLPHHPSNTNIHSPSNPHSKIYPTAASAVADIQSGSTILSAGFGLCGTAESLIHAMVARGPESLNNLTAVSNNAGASGDGGLSPLTRSGQVSRCIMSYLGNNKRLEEKYLSGQMAIELCPQGTLAERIRAAGAGIPAFYTSTGVGTGLETGEIPLRVRRGDAGESVVVEEGRKRESRAFGERRFVLEHALPGDVAIVRAHRVDRAGNVQFRYTTKAFGTVMAKAARLTIVEAEEIVDVGVIGPDEVDVPGIYVDRVVKAEREKLVEIRKLRKADDGAKEEELTPALVRRNRIAKRAARELKDGMYVNLGVGMPTLAPSYLPKDVKVWIQSENGILGMGPYPTEAELDPDIVNAGKETVTLVKGASTFDSCESFGMIRGGHVDVSVLGALQVSAAGDLANYMVPGKVFKGMGGAMDLVSNPNQTKIVVTTDHVDKYGRSKIVQQCALPLTGARVVSTIITDLAVFQVDRERGTLTLTEIADGHTLEEIREKTDAEFGVAESLGSF